jgi:hypothetical protein
MDFGKTRDPGFLTREERLYKSILPVAMASSVTEIHSGDDSAEIEIEKQIDINCQFLL